MKLLPKVFALRQNQPTFSTTRQLDFLRVIDQTTFEKIQHVISVGAAIPIEGIPLEFTGTHSDFDQKKTRLFSSLDYHEGVSSAYSNLQVRTNPVAYKYWAECMQGCMTTDGFHAYVEREDGTEIVIRARYVPPPGASTSIPLHINVTNGRMVGAGVYLYRIEAGAFREKKKMVLLP